MKSIQKKRILAYRRFKNGFLVVGTGPDRHWIMAGGQLVGHCKKTKEIKQ